VDDRYEPETIDVARDEGVTVTYLDGEVARFDLMRLRLSCPCATCRGLRDRGEAAWPRPGSPTPLRIADAALHGAWGLSITWNDGHSAGIYPWESLRRWHDGGTPFGADSGLGGAAP
jgi:DUF971 family protein